MLTGIHLLNFKSFIDQKLGLMPMTLLAGLNNSGKSSVIQALRMLWKWSETGDMNLPGHGSSKEIKNKSSAVSDPIKVVCFFKKYQTEMKIEFKESDSDSCEKSVHINERSLVNKIKDTKFEFHSPLRLQDCQLPLMNYVSAERWGPRVSLPIFTGSGDLSNMGEHGEYAIDFLSRHERDIVPQLLRHPKAEGDTLEYNVRAWLKEISPNVKFKHGTDPQRDMAFTTIDGFRPTNTGFGLSYTLPVIISLLGMAAEWEDNEKQKAKTELGTLVMLENPEAHLHPQGQTSIGKLISLSAASGVQVIVETHSDHLMDGIRIAVKEGKLSPDMTAFHYFTSDKSGVTIVESPKIQSNGKLDYWPKGFFDQTMQNRAILARR